MANVLVPIQWNGLAQGYCFTTWDQLGLDLSDAQQAVIPGMAFYNVGPTVPAPEYQGYPWLNTGDGRWYTYSGGWIAPANLDASERRIWVGTLGAGAGNLDEYDGGDSGALSDRTGPMWVEDVEFRGRFPLGVGTLPLSGTVVGVTDNGGLDEVTLTETQLAAHTHYLACTAGNSKTDLDPVSTMSDRGRFSDDPGEYMLSGWPAAANPATVGVSGEAGAGVSEAVGIMPPYRGVYVIKPSGRQYYMA